MMSIIVAMTKNKVIGNELKIPWHISEDFKHFKQTTLNSVIIMGRKTYESIGKPLPQRVNIVVSKTLEKSPDFELANSFEEAIKIAKGFNKKIFLIGGSSIYKEGLKHADELIISWIKKDYPGNIHFPKFNEDDWIETKAKEHDEFTIRWYKKK